MKQQPTLYLMLGYPGAGKTTVAEVLAKLTGAIHINSDYVRLRAFNPPRFNKEEHKSLYNTIDYLSELILKSGKSVIYDANLNKHQYRQEKYDICKKVEANCQLIWIKTDKSVAQKRATLDAPQHPKHRPFGNMPEDMFKRLINELEEPKENESPIILNGTQIEKSEIAKLLTEKLNLE